MTAYIHNLKRPWPLFDITSFSHMQKIEVTGASDLASLFLHQGCFCVAYCEMFLLHYAITHMGYLSPCRRCNQRVEMKHLMCDIVVCIATTQDNAEMNCLAYEIKLGTSIVSLSTVCCKFDSLNMCILQYCVIMTMCSYVFSVFVGDCNLIIVHLIIYSLARTVCIHFY